MQRLWIDTNETRSVVTLSSIAQLAWKKGVKPLIHPQVYLEQRRQKQVQLAKKGETFDAVKFDNFLKQERVDVAPFHLDQALATLWADELYRRYPTTKLWEDAKKQTLGGKLKAGFEVLPGDMPMTTDWLISLLVEGDPSARIITRDKGEEWRALRAMVPARALTFAEAEDWLNSLPDEPVAEP